MTRKFEPKVVVIGGGTGSFTLLQALKNHTTKLTALVNMADDGGSTGVLRDEFGVLPPGDVRQCLVALSNSSASLRELFNYRFPSGSSFGGHSFGNLLLSAVEMMTSDFGEAVQLASEVLNITGRVLPVTLESCNLILETYGGAIEGEYKIANLAFDGKSEPPDLKLYPTAKLNPLAKEAIMGADFVVIAPGNLYGSLVPALLVEGMPETLEATKASVAFVCNLVNKPIQTKDFAVHDYVRELERFIGDNVIDYVLYNTDTPSKKVLEAYALDGEFPVGIDKSELDKARYKTIGGNFLSRQPRERDMNDTFILRSLIRHDAEAVSRQLMKVCSHVTA